jgi:hypothetical protein
MRSTPPVAHRERVEARCGAGTHFVPGRLAAVAAASVLTLAGCVPVVASGPMASEEREIGAVTAVTLDTSGALSISEGEPRLVIHAPSGALDRMTAETDGETLRLGTTPGPAIVLGEFRYELTVADLQAITVNGSGDVVATVSSAGSIRLDLDGSGDIAWTGLDTDDVTVRVAGSGDIELAGTTTALMIELDGSGDIDAAALQARNAVVSIAGSGDVRVAATDTLSAEISGSGEVSYSGDPEVDADVSGSGDVVRDE